MVGGSVFHKVGPETAKLFDHISSFWSAVLPDRRVLRNEDVSDS